MTNTIATITILTAVGSTIVAGIFFVFSASVMQALRQLNPAEGIRAMQAINLTILNPFFLGLFIGTAALGLVAAGLSAWAWHQPGALWGSAGGLTYFFGVFGLTGALNVPMNKRLDLFAPESRAGHEYWAHYLSRWTKLNHLRTIAAMLASLFLIFSILHWQ